MNRLNGVDPAVILKCRRGREAWRRQLRFAITAFHGGEFAVAMHILTKAQEVAPKEPYVLRSISLVWQRRGDYCRAEAYLRRAIDLSPESVNASVALARILLDHGGRYRDAITVAERVLDYHPGNLNLAQVLGDAWVEAGSWRLARTNFESILKVKPQSGRARIGQAQTYNLEGVQLGEAGSVESALFAFRRAAALDPAWSAPWVNLGVGLQRLGKFARASAAYHEALVRDPQNPLAYFNLGSVEVLRHRPDLAASAVETLLELVPDYPKARVLLAHSLLSLGDSGRAIARLIEEIEAVPRSSTAWSMLGLAYICGGNIDQAERCLCRALELAPEDATQHLNLALLYMSEGRRYETERVLRNIISPLPHDCQVGVVIGERWRAERPTGSCPLPAIPDNP